MNDILYVKAQESGERIDALLARSIENLTRSQAQRLLESGLVTADGAPVKKNRKTVPGELYRVEIPEAAETELVAQDIPLDIVYEDGDVIVVNKPRGMVVHPAPGHPDGTLVNALMFHCGDNLSGINGVIRPGIVHRIDMDTTGSLVVCKNDSAHQSLSAQLKDHSIRRIYEAIVHGNIKEEEGMVVGEGLKEGFCCSG